MHYMTENMAIKRNHRNANNDDSDDSSSGDDWTSTNDSEISAKSSRTDVAVDYSIASSSHGSNQSMATKLPTTPRRHTGPRKPRVNEKVRP